ncbi:IPT/TIG domain-containing protein [Skeletonema marinoi]|uniref:IPT/TIG domain-containing protein n=2 Tax=Skeletonema marinoi TaxID=267567 RepID=A0AAD9D4M3_9STRA|nr:IPT/TIG domain-containing protein [Skeletonema marinoi]
MMNERGILPCDIDINGVIKSQSYNLEIHYYPLPWFDLLNRFEFSQGIYFVFYTLIALVICSIGGFVYGTNRILTKLRRPPRFMGMSLLQLISRPQLEGLLLAIIPYTAVVLTIHSWFSDSSSWFEGMRGAWSDKGKIDAKTEVHNSMCRLARLSSCWVSSPFTARRKFSSQTKQWKYSPRAKRRILDVETVTFLWTSLVIEAILMCVWEFSYSETFKNNLFRFKVLFQMMQILLDLILSSIMGDRLLAAPLLVSIQMAEMLITCGAHNFVDFTLVFLLEVALNVFQRLLLYPLLKTITVLWPRWKILVSRAVNNRGLTIEAKKQRELEFKSVNEEIELRTEGIEPLLDSLSIYSMEKTGGMLLPFMCLLLILLYRETEMASRYNINQHDLLYYCLFAFYMIPWMSLVDSLVLSSQELLYGWRMHDYLSFQRWRFENRANMWNLLSQKDDSVSRSLQNMDLLCFSSQYYFILTLISIGFGTNMLGLTICLRKRYNFLADPVFPLVVAIVILLSELIARMCILISNNKVDVICWNGIWRVAEGKGVMDDVIAAKLAIGEGRQEDLEEERRDLMALNSDSFRRKFIDKNRPWILQHLIQLVTPRSLQSTGPDNRPLVDYIRDVYSDLQTVGEGKRRPGDADVSSDDSSDDEFEMRRQWERTPLDGSRLLIAQIWLQKARKRRVFTSTISGIIDKRKDDHCHSCYQTCSYESLTVGLAWEGDYSTSAIDNLIHLFETIMGPKSVPRICGKRSFANMHCSTQFAMIARRRHTNRAESVHYTKPCDPRTLAVTKRLIRKPKKMKQQWK